MSIRVALMLGARANAWHSEVFAHLPGDIDPVVVGTRDGRYPVDDIPVPFVALRWENQVGPWWRRKLTNLRYRLLHSRTGYELRLAPAAAELGPFAVLNTWELFTEWTRLALEERARRGVPLLVTVWDNLPGHFADCPRRGPVRRRCLAEADRFLVVSQLAQAALELDGVAPERIVRVEPSVDTERFHPGDEPELRARLGVGQDDILVLCVARLELAKGIGYLLDGFARALAAEARLRLLVVGEGPEAASLAAQATRLGIAARVTFRAVVPYREMPAVHRAADLFVLPSVPTPDWQEQWGQSLLEAMACGRATVASLTGGIPEMLGETGLLIEPGDERAIAAAISSLAADDGRRQGLGRRARVRVEARYAHSAAARVMGQLYRELATRGLPGAHG